jgi:hypothetical protein
MNINSNIVPEHVVRVLRAALEHCEDEPGETHIEYRN